MKTFISDISGKEFSIDEMVKAKTIRKSIFDFIKKEHNLFDENAELSIDELNFYRQRFISEKLVNEVGELNDLKKQVVDSISKSELISDESLKSDTKKDAIGEKIADKVADFGGSWTFILSFVFFLLLWIGVNAFIFMNKGFDPYPFILLNLILSCVAALQAPIIMMSQNRQEAKDRERAKNDYMVNLKSELEIRILHEKIDHLIMHQQQELMEIQKVQTELMHTILEEIKKDKKL
ncbi:Uncharacterized membrane protein [Paenimyroides ummariense]|uniref:Uncharacterized membrane protein n=1 Tax=Paenimyroides ummariense TaxID=913024 RepID=A0A1I5AJ81_9FLAO|nr:DUF1003 domain-containing protein [Paenimyroides ummariense]SFN62556.1 Uncharacterized membrane protein [Paenimyroides ummariense]